MVCIGKGNKYVQSMLLGSGAIPTAVYRWNLTYQNLKWKDIFSLCFQTTVDVQLRWFQARVLHRLLPTEKYLFKCRLSDSPLCTFCQQENETLSHLLWNCNVVRNFWETFLNCLHEKCFHLARFQFCEQLVMFGISDGVITDKGMDFIILFAKFYIYKCKLQNNQPSVLAFLRQLGKLKDMSSVFKVKVSNLTSTGYHIYNCSVSVLFTLEYYLCSISLLGVFTLTW